MVGTVCVEYDSPMNKATCDNYKDLSDEKVWTKGKAQCVCEDGYVKVNNTSDKCVDKTECIKLRKCGSEDEQYDECINACSQSCKTTTHACTMKCGAGCACKNNFCRDYNGKCVDRQKHQNPHATKDTCIHHSECPNQCKVMKCDSVNEAYVEECPINRCSEKCSENGIPNTCTQECGKCGCYCIEGYCRNENQVCVPKTEVDHNQCDVTCDNYKKFNWGHENKQCNKCPKGYVCISSKDHTCVAKEDCVKYGKCGTKAEVVVNRCDGKPCNRKCHGHIKPQCPEIKCLAIGPPVCECAENYCEIGKKCVLIPKHKPVYKPKNCNDCKTDVDVDASAAVIQM
ncbi:Cysteine-rich venom protein 6-like protein [Leptotrombidium deliense]|uniref:Cysteine-rich venom protein 6-like protein n=1 Tax=Leptotrombidium deliense TaxID=299467 RepID=A0A443SBR7_9ACAR|nr:Cysteine-rich venom protein 6-like protein [Leptotrombidium deliense]